MTAPVRRPELMTASRLKALGTCPRLHQNRYILQRVPRREAPALRNGTAIHAALEAWWKAFGRGADGETALAEALAALAETLAALDPYDAVRLEAMVRGYHLAWWGWAVEHVAEVIGVEMPFAYPMMHPLRGGAVEGWTVAGKMDGLLRLRDGRVAVLEHKCLPGSARIFNHATGLYELVSDLYERQAELVVTAADEVTLRPVVVPACPVRLAAVQPIVKVTTACGRTLRVSDNHPVMTHRGWVAAGHLSGEDWLAAPKHIESAIPDAPLSDEAFRLIGYMIGDGSVATGMSITKRDANVMADVVSCAAGLGEVAVPKYPGQSAPYIQFSLVGPVSRLVELAGLRGHRAGSKRLPFHLAPSDRQLGQLLAGLWGSDGCVDLFNGRKPRIIYTSVCRDLCEDIQHALQRIGIPSSVRTTSVAYKGERRAVSTVQVVSREGKRRFLGLVQDGFIPLCRMKHPADVVLAAIPDCLQASDATRQPRLCDHVWWDRVESVEVEAPEQTYDVEVPGLHTFVVDGILTHNTAGEDTRSGSDYQRKLTLDGQVSQYFDGAAFLGYPAEVCIYDILQKPTLRPALATPQDQRRYTQARSRACALCKKKNAPPAPHIDPELGVSCVDGRVTTDPGGVLYAGMRDADETLEEYAARIGPAVAADLGAYFRHVEVVRFDAQLTEHRVDLWHATRHLTLLAHDLGPDALHPKNPSACFRYGRCAYLEVCEGVASLSDDLLFRTLETAHPELDTHPSVETAVETQETNE